MSKFAIRFGHQATGTDGASVGIIKEFDVIREYGPYVIAGLQGLGHTVYNVTPPEASRSLGDSLMYGVNQANNLGVDYFISLHANDFDDPSVHGCEVVYGSASGGVLAKRIVDQLNSIGFNSHRGAYTDERGLAEIRNTDMIANIVEPFFISNQNDVDLYKSIGPERLGYAIVKGITGQDVQVSNINKGVNKVEKLVVHGGGADERAAEYLADYLKCPIVHKDNASNLINQAGNIYVVGGTWKPTDNAILISGQDRFDTMKAVLKYIGKL